MNIWKKAAAMFCAAVIIGTSAIAFAYETNVTVKLDGLANEASDTVYFENLVQIESYTYVPARALAEAAGMSVEWDQPSQTAFITINADANSRKPIEQYASELINKISGYGLDLKPESITAALRLDNENAVIRYNFADSDGDTVSIGKSVKMSNAARLSEEQSLIIPLRDSMEIFGLEVDWNQEDLSIKISLPENAVVPSGLRIIADNAPDEGEYSEYEVDENSPVDQSPNLGTYIGRFKITHYCPCSVCNGGWGAHTAWAGEIVPGQTVAVDPSVIGKLKWIYIDGYGVRRAEDCGGGVNGYHIDVAVSNHAEALASGISYRDVYYSE